MSNIQSLQDTAIQFALFYGFIIAGYLFAKLSGRGKFVNKYLNLLLINFLIPLLFIDTLLTTSPEAVSDVPLIVAFTILMHLLGPILVYIRFRGRDFEDSIKGAYYICITFNNALFIPLPLVLMFIGPAGLPIVITFSLTQMMLLATLGTFMGAAFGDKTAGYTKIAKDALTFPPLIASLFAAGLFFANFRLPDDIANALNFVGPVTTYLALISVGLSIGIRFSLAEVRAALEGVAIRQVLIPLIVIPLVLLSGLSQLPASIIILEVIMPPAILTVVYSTSFGLDSERAASIVTVGTIFLLPIIPFIPLLLG